MKKVLFSILFSVTMLMATRVQVQAQEYKVNRSTGKMIMNLPSVLIEGYGGNEIIFSSQSKPPEIDPKAKGLQTISNSGYMDNTGLGISVVEKGTTIEVNQVIPDLAIKILVPKSVILSFVYHKVVVDTEKVIFRNMENEIEIETDYNNVSLENITGPVTVRTLYGSVNAIFSTRVTGPVSILSMHSDVDVTIPVDTKANIRLKSVQRTIMASPEFKIAVEKSEEKDTDTDNSSQVLGKLNGGGEEILLASQFGKIYLRKTK